METERNTTLAAVTGLLDELRRRQMTAELQPNGSVVLTDDQHSRLLTAPSMSILLAALPEVAPRSFKTLPDAVLVRKASDLPLPDSLENLESEAKGIATSDLILAHRRAELIAHARKGFFESPGTWLSWAMQSLGLTRRRAFSYLKAGILLLAHRDQPLGQLTQCSIEKITILTAVPSNELASFCAQHKPAAITRDELRAIVKAECKQLAEPGVSEES